MHPIRPSPPPTPRHRGAPGRADDPAATIAPLSYHGWRLVAACFLLACVSWSLVLFGNSVYVSALSAAHGWPVATVASAVSLMYVVSASLQRPVAWAIRRVGPRPVLAAAALAECAGVASLGFIDHPAGLVPAFVLLGIGWSAISTTGLSMTVNPWFERHQGRAITLAVMGASLGAIAGVPLLLGAIGAWGLRTGLAVVALAGLAVMLPLILTMMRHRSPEALGLAPDGVLPRAWSSPAGVAGTAARRAGRPDEGGRAAWAGGTLDENARTAHVATVAIAFSIALLVQIGFVTHHLAIAARTMSLPAAGLLVSATGVSALLGRLVMAVWVDRMPVRALAAGLFVLQGAMLAGLALVPGPAATAFASVVYGLGIGYVTTLAPVIVRRELGPRDFALRYGWVAMPIQFTSAAGPALYGLLHDAWGGYGPVLATGAGAMAVAAGALIAPLARRAARKDGMADNRANSDTSPP